MYVTLANFEERFQKSWKIVEKVKPHNCTECLKLFTKTYKSRKF